MNPTVKRISRVLKHLQENWNSLLALTSLFGFLLFSLIPQLQRYTTFFVFLGANALVWTTIEIRNHLLVHDEPAEVRFPNMRQARPRIVREIEECLPKTTLSKPLEVQMIGGRLRSMSDIVREVSDDLRSKRIDGHVHITLFHLSPEYIESRSMPFETEPHAQERRARADVVRTLAKDMVSHNWSSDDSSITIQLTTYSEDPHLYAYLIGDRALLWGPFTYNVATSDFIGPENPCWLMKRDDADFASIHNWLRSRIRLYGLMQSAQETDAIAVTRHFLD